MLVLLTYDQPMLSELKESLYFKNRPEKLKDKVIDSDR